MWGGRNNSGNTLIDNDLEDSPSSPYYVGHYDSEDDEFSIEVDTDNEEEE